MLHDSVVLFCGFDELSAFENIVAEWLFDVDVFARLAGPDCPQRVPMIGRCDRYGVDAFIGQAWRISR